MSTSLALSFRDVQFDVVDQNGQPWLRGLQIASALGFKNPSSDIANLYDRNADEFTDAMTALVKLPDLNLQSASAGQMREVRIFSLRGCHLLGMLARTKIAKEFRKWVLDILDRETNPFTLSPQNPAFRPEKTRKALPGGLTIEQQDAVKALVKSRVEALPQDVQAKGAITCWSSIKSKFGCTYKEVPADNFAEVLSLVARLPLEKEPLKALPLAVHYPLESAAPPAGESGLGYYAFTLESWKDPNWELLLKLRDAGFNVDGPIYSHQAKIHVITAMYNALINKAVESLNSCCVRLPYAPVYLR